MAFRYKIDIMQALKDKGFSTYKIRKEKIFGEKTLQDFRHNRVVFSEPTMEKLCTVLDLDISDILEHYTIDQLENEEEANIEPLPDITDLL